jgi:asparagine synthase (glutamine-hydrolysing)
MCGISAVVTRETKSDLLSIAMHMNSLIEHRGPDGFGYYMGPNFALGHRRLAILDLSDAGKQPMEYANKYVITYNGEVYNYVELKNELEKDGYTFHSHTDTEVILAAYDKWGQDCVSRFNGMWAFVLYDKQKNILFCSRDRFGVKPFYFAQIGDKFVCASEIKQFTCLDSWKPRLNRRTAFDFLEYGVFDHTQETLFEQVYQLRGGHSLVYELKRHTHSVTKWYDLERSAKVRQIDMDTAVEMFRDLITDSIRLRLRSDVKVGSCLSGGLDSSTIVCIANELLRQQGAHDKQETVSSCFDERDFDERQYIDEVIKKTQATSHRVFPKFSDLPLILDKLTWHQDEPFGSTSFFAQWHVFRTAREKNIIVMLDGQGADEALAGYYPFFSPFLANLVSTFQLTKFLKEIWSLRKLHGNATKGAITAALKLLLPKSFGSVKRAVFGWKASDLFDFAPEREEASVLMEKHVGIHDFSLVLLLYSSLPMLLHYEDRNSMAHSVESRVPFLDYRLLEFIVGLPEDQKIRNGKTKFILRESMKNILPEKISNRHDKLGFVTPEKIWLRNEKDWFCNELRETIDVSKGLVNKKILSYVDAVNSGMRPFDFTLWRTLSFGRWMKAFSVTI